MAGHGRRVSSGRLTVSLVRGLTTAVLLASIAVPVASSSGIRFARESRRILAPGHGEFLLSQCSRNTPHGVTSYWLPTSVDIDTLEQRLLLYLSKSENPPDGEYAGTYVGILTNGKKLIYANFSPRSGPDMVCDGGPRFWGVVFDPLTNKFSDLEFNGVA
jgi:hypothetical protein